MTEKREIPFGRPWITEEGKQAVLDVLGGHILTHGPQGKAFEAEFSALIGDGAISLSVSSCMAALHMLALHAGFGPGDEVLVPAMTHTATVHAVEWVGARPVFVDCDPQTGNVTPDGLAAAVTPKTKGIVLVHFAGIPCDMTGIMALAGKHGLRVIEDCAIALGARWEGRHVGMFGDAGCFSFYPVKHITTGEGGMVITRHQAVATAIGKLRAFGVDRTHAERVVPGFYDVPDLGLNYRMSEMQAALGRTQLHLLDEIFRKRAENFAHLKRGLAGIDGLAILDSVDPRGPNSPYVLSVVLQGALGARRNDIVRALNEDGVGTSIYYPQPVNRLTYYRNKYGFDAARYPNATAIADHSFALPIGPHIGIDEMDYIAGAVSRAVEKELAHGR